MKKIRLIYLFRILSLTLLMAGTWGCGSDSSDNPSQQNNVYWKSSGTVTSEAASSAIMIEGAEGTTWSAEITQGTSWCSFGNSASVTAKSGSITAGLNILYVYYSANTGSAQRNATISFTFGGEASQTLELSQIAASQQNLPAFNSWPEIPSQKTNANYVYVAHYSTLNQKSIRNYSICFDKSREAALWVAYPLHSAYLGNISRTDAWAFDPFIPDNYQADCITKSYGGNYDRGHQIPSADRLATNEMNAQTFYMSNMTPQLNRLNQDMWAKLEAKVRANRCSDTLYVVTGAYFGAGATTTTDGAGNVVPIPTNYFKVLLRTKSGNSGKAIKDCTDSELISIGFWVDQKSYGNIEPPTSICTSVANIEAKTGFNFFPLVSTAVKSQNIPSQWGIN